MYKVNSSWQEILESFKADKAYEWKKNTEVWYSDRLSHFLTFLSDKGVTPEVLGEREVKSYLATLRDKSYSTKVGQFTVLKVFFRFLARRGLIGSNPFADENSGLKRPRKTRQVPKTIKREHIVAMIEAAKVRGGLSAVRDVAIMTLFATTGIRRIELVQIKLKDVDLNAGEVLVKGKYDNERLVYLDEQTTVALKNYLNTRPTCKVDYLFITASNSRRGAKGIGMTPDSLNTMMKRWRALAGICEDVSVSPHKWRHAFATKFAEKSQDAFALQAFLGHTSIQTTKIYVNYSRETLKKLALGFNALEADHA